MNFSVPVAIICVSMPAVVRAQSDSPIQDCITDQVVTNIYPYRGDTASFQVTTLGNILIRPNRAIDENDVVRVYVLTTRQLAPKLRVKRTSQFRPVGVVNVIGDRSGEQNAIAQVRDAVQSPNCLLKVNLFDFAPGEGQVAISMVDTDSNPVKETALGNFAFAVNPLYVGAFSLGPVRTNLEEPSFAIASNGSTSYVSRSESGRRLLYSLFYTPFIWGRRDLEKTDFSQPWKHLNPTLGLVLNDVQHNALIGASFDLPIGMFVTGGAHFGRVTQLDPESGLTPGDTLQTPPSSIPTIKTWDHDWFISVNLDLRVAVKFFRTAGSTTIP